MGIEASRTSKSFARTYDSIPKIMDCIEEFFEGLGIDRKHLGVVNLAVEEIFTNMVKYNPQVNHDIAIELEKQGRDLAVSLIDHDVAEFDITKVPPVDVDRPLEERVPGGLGIHLVKKLMDRIEYEHTPERVRTTIYKTLEYTDV